MGGRVYLDADKMETRLIAKSDERRIVLAHIENMPHMSHREYL